MELNNSNMKKLIKLIIITVLVVFCVFRFDKIYACGTWIIGLLMPFVIGFAIAFILNVPMKGFENLLFRNEKSRWYRFRRPVCMVLSIICVVLVIAFVITIVAIQIVGFDDADTGGQPDNYSDRTAVPVYDGGN